MKKFRFPLEQVRRWRLTQMEAEEARLQQCLARLQAVYHMEAELKRQRERADQDIRSQHLQGPLIQPAQLESCERYRSYLRRVEMMLVGRRAEVLARVHEQREHLLEARRKFEVLDRYRGKTQRLWNEELNREQESFSAEMYLARWNKD